VHEGRCFTLGSGQSDLSFFRDYAPNELLDRYSDADIDDEGEYDAMDPRARRAAEASMNRRDRQSRTGRGARAARRSRPTFLESDDIEDDEDPNGGLLSGLKQRTRRQYDERRDIDDMEGIEDVSITNAK
jgi:DNA replication licensing factor MCM2